MIVDLLAIDIAAGVHWTEAVRREIAAERKAQRRAEIRAEHRARWLARRSS